MKTRRLDACDQVDFGGEASAMKLTETISTGDDQLTDMPKRIGSSSPARPWNA